MANCMKETPLTKTKGDEEDENIRNNELKYKNPRQKRNEESKVQWNQKKKRSSAGELSAGELS